MTRGQGRMGHELNRHLLVHPDLHWRPCFLLHKNMRENQLSKKAECPMFLISATKNTLSVPCETHKNPTARFFREPRTRQPPGSSIDRPLAQVESGLWPSEAASPFEESSPTAARLIARHPTAPLPTGSRRGGQRGSRLVKPPFWEDHFSVK